MRLRRASASNGIVNKRIRLSQENLLLSGMALVGLWMLGSLLQELSLNHSLSQQAAGLRERNAALATTNDGYRKDISAISSGAAAEEEARKDGYARSDERLYIVATPPPSTPPPAPRPAAARAGSANPLEALWHLLTGIPAS